jgi:hypothetical protein
MTITMVDHILIKAKEIKIIIPQTEVKNIFHADY